MRWNKTIRTMARFLPSFSTDWFRFSNWRYFPIPSVCMLCKSYYRGSDAICLECYTYFKPLPQHCATCAVPISSISLECRNCAREQPVYDETITAYAFEEPLRTLLHRYKYQGALHLRSVFVRLMAEAYAKRRHDTIKTQCLIPVPLHAKKLRARGFNQASEFAAALGEQFAIPYHFQYCTRRIAAESQASSTALQRRQNLLNAFNVKPLPYKHVTLVDDVVTTGSTVNALAKILKKQGVERVSVWCCARTVPRSHVI